MKSDKNLTKIKINKFISNNKFFLVIIIVLILIGSFSLIIGINNEKIISKKFGDDKIDMYYFHSKTCPHCLKQNEFNKYLIEKYPNLNIIKYEISEPKFEEELEKMAKAHPLFDINKFGTPTTFIGDEFNVGYGSDEITGEKLIQMIEKEQERINKSWNDTMVKTIDLNK